MRRTVVTLLAAAAALLLALALLQWWSAFWCAVALVAFVGWIVRFNIKIERAYSRRNEFWR